MNATKKSYHAPKLIIHGDVEVLTQAIKLVLDALDFEFPADAPLSSWTFS